MKLLLALLSMFMLFIVVICHESPIYTEVFPRLSKHGNKKLQTFTNLHNLTEGSAFGVRSAYNRTWEAFHDDIVAGGHRWCAIQKDLWSCAGSAYIDKLKHTVPYQKAQFDPRRLHAGTKILFDGNSFLAEIMYGIICETDPDLVLHIGTNNNILAHYQENNVTILGLDNDHHIQGHLSILTEILQEIHFHPMFIILSSLNYFTAKPEDKPLADAERMQFYASLWPEAVLIPWFLIHLDSDCTAEGRDCGVFTERPAHQCFPGPLVRSAEHLMGRMLWDNQFINVSAEHLARYFETSVTVHPGLLDPQY